MNQYIQNKGGISIIGIIILAIILILILSYFGYDIRSIVESPKAKENLNYVGGVVEDLWNKFFKKPAEYVWENFFLKLSKKINTKDSVNFENLAPNLPLK